MCKADPDCPFRRPCPHHDLAEEEPDEGEFTSPDIVGIEPCSVCGAPGACAWDSEGRPLIHAYHEDEE